MAVDGGIDSEGEEVLVVGGHDSRGDEGSVGNGLVEVDRGCGEDARGADFVVDGGVLGELEGEDVLVVADGDYGLKDEDPGSGYDGVAGAVVGVFPEDPVVYLVAADHVGEDYRITCSGVVVAVEILNVAQAVTS